MRRIDPARLGDYRDLWGGIVRSKMNVFDHVSAERSAYEVIIMTPQQLCVSYDAAQASSETPGSNRGKSRTLQAATMHFREIETFDFCISLLRRGLPEGI